MIWKLAFAMFAVPEKETSDMKAVHFGIENRNLVPRPGSDSTQIRPPIRSTTFLQIAKPTPAPGCSDPCKR
jgi:hypothetical protein